MQILIFSIKNPKFFNQQGKKLEKLKNSSSIYLDELLYPLYTVPKSSSPMQNDEKFVFFLLDLVKSFTYFWQKLISLKKLISLNKMAKRNGFWCYQDCTRNVWLQRYRLIQKVSRTPRHLVMQPAAIIDFTVVINRLISQKL